MAGERDFSPGSGRKASPLVKIVDSAAGFERSLPAMALNSPAPPHPPPNPGLRRVGRRGGGKKGISYQLSSIAMSMKTLRCAIFIFITALPPSLMLAGVAVREIPERNRGSVTEGRFDYDKSRLNEFRLRYISAAEIAHWTEGQIRYAINFVYAKNGYAFKDGPIRAVFDSMDWYSPLEGWSIEQIDTRMNEYEVSNIKVLAEVRSSK